MEKRDYEIFKKSPGRPGYQRALLHSASINIWSIIKSKKN